MLAKDHLGMCDRPVNVNERGFAVGLTRYGCESKVDLFVMVEGY